MPTGMAVFFILSDVHPKIGWFGVELTGRPDRQIVRYQGVNAEPGQYTVGYISAKLFHPRFFPCNVFERWQHQ